MSVAERTAHQVYKQYNIGALADDVQRQLIILMLNRGVSFPKVEQTDETEVSDSPYTSEELHERIALSEAQFKNGQYLSNEEVSSNVDKLFASWS